MMAEKQEPSSSSFNDITFKIQITGKYLRIKGLLFPFLCLLWLRKPIYWKSLSVMQRQLWKPNLLHIFMVPRGCTLCTMQPLWTRGAVCMSTPLPRTTARRVSHSPHVLLQMMLQHSVIICRRNTDNIQMLNTQKQQGSINLPHDTTNDSPGVLINPHLWKMADLWNSLGAALCPLNQRWCIRNGNWFFFQTQHADILNYW